MKSDDFAAIRTRLLTAKNVLLAAHLKPDGDAIGSTMGLATFLRQQGRSVTVLFPEGIPELYQLQSADFTTETPDFSQFDLIVLLDTAVPERAGFSREGGVPDAVKERLQIIDHHPDNPKFGKWNYVEHRAATAEIACELCESFEAALPEAAANWFLMGLLTDTGGFRFDNTDPEALRAGARLLEAGAKLNKVVNCIYFNKPVNQQLFEAELVKDHLRWACDKRMVWAVITPELLAKYDVSLRNTEGVIDLLRALAGTEIAALISHRANGGCRVSMRSKNPARPVINLAHKYNGGGHAMAAGMTIMTEDLEEASRVLESEAATLFPECGQGGAQ